MTTTNKNTTPTLLERLEYILVRTIIGAVRLLPYRRRVSTMGWIVQRVIAPLAGFNQRVRNNLELALPEMPESERNAVIGRTTNNIGRQLGEMFSPEDFVKMARAVQLEGPGLPAIDEALASGRPVIFLSGHFGNYDVLRAALIHRGFDLGGLYRRMNNPLFNAYYLNNISMIGTPMFQRGRKGFGHMLRHLKGGGALAALIDVRAGSGAPLTFFGQEAWTALSMAELALKYDAMLVPCFSIRQADGITFKAIIEEPIPHSDPAEMTQHYNDILESRVRENIDQWFWIHRRWKSVGRSADQA